VKRRSVPLRDCGGGVASLLREVANAAAFAEGFSFPIMWDRLIDERASIR